MKRMLLVLLFLGFTAAGAVDLLLVDDNATDHSDDQYHINFPNLDMVEGKLDELGIAYTHEHDNRWRYPGITENPEYLDDYRIIIFYNDQRVITQKEYDTLLEWVSEGNYLIVTGYDSLGNPNDPLMAQLVGSATYGDYPYCDSFGVCDSDNFIMDGPWGYFSGSYPIIPDASDHDWAQPLPGTRKLATACTGHVLGPAKILLTENVGDGGIIIYWNGNWDSIEWWRMSQTPATVNMFRNIMDYLVALVPVQETSWGGIKGMFTP